MMPRTFAQLGVPQSICRALVRRGIGHPFEIQAAAIPDMLLGRDVCGRAPTGSGKTLAFGIPLVATMGRATAGRPQGLVLSPTRELADQIASELRSFAGDVRVGVVYGGVGYDSQVKQLRRGVDIVVACPGRLEDLIKQHAISLDDVDKVVIDEADRLADMGFVPAVRRLLNQTAAERQTVMFSATLDGDVADLSRDYQHEPIVHDVEATTADITAADHHFWSLGKADRIDISARLIRQHAPAIVFCRTRHGSDRLARQLTQRGVSAAAIHGGHAQARRTRALARFASGAVQALVATDVAARGIHVDDLAAVVHFDPPADHKTYIHRSGRTARAGRRGLVVSLLRPDQITEAERIKRKLGLDQLITDAHTAVSDPRATHRPAAPDPDDAERRRRRGHSTSMSGNTHTPLPDRGPDRPDGRRRSRNRRHGLTTSPPGR